MSYNAPPPNQPGYQPFPQAHASAPLHSSYDSHEDISSSGYAEPSTAEANYYKRRSQYTDAYNDPYGPRSLRPSDQGPPAARSSASIGPWDSASQRSLSISSRIHPLPSSYAAPLSDAYSDPNAGRHLKNKPSNMTAGGLSYIDEEGDYHRSRHVRPASSSGRREDELEMHGLVSGAAHMGARDNSPERAVLNGTYGEGKYGQFEDGPHAWPPLENVSSGVRQESRLMSLLLFPTGLDRLLAPFGWDRARVPIDQAIERKRRGVPGQRWPVMTWVLTAIMVGVMIYDRSEQRSNRKPYRYSTYLQLYDRPYAVGAHQHRREIPAMYEAGGGHSSHFQLCLSGRSKQARHFSLPSESIADTGSPPTSLCTLAQICGHGMTTTGTPSQSWRFFTPIFLHVGIIHLILNMLAQMTAGAQIEREMGSIPFLIVYFAGGVYGFLLGGNFSRVGIPSAGASGALFAVNACVLVDLVMHWKYEERPKLKAFLVAVEFVIGIAIGYIPNAVDGLAHLGGFAMGLLLGSILYPSISETRTHRFVLWGVRLVAAALAVMAFILTTRNFYTADPNAACTWCKYLSCIPVSANNYCSGTGITQTTVQSIRRMLEL